MFTPTSPVTGSAISGLSSPTYTLTSDSSGTNAAKLYAVTALGGTQTGVSAHSTDQPFTVRASRPKLVKVLSPVASGQLRKSIPKNVYKVSTSKSVVIDLVTGESSTVIVETSIRVPVGCVLADPTSLSAALSCHGGVISDTLQGIRDTAANGIL